jgi:hypothetical protein
MAEEYEINEKDIDSVIRWLKIHDPENATPEMAIEILEEMYARVHLMSHEDPELLEKIYRDLRSRKQSS